MKRLLVLMLLMTISAGGFVFMTREAKPTIAAPEVVGAQALAINDLNLSLLSQQLDEIFQILLIRLSSVEALTPEERLLLQSWLQFDERFVTQNQDQSALSYERVTAHLRLGKGLLLLDEPIASSSHFQSAIELLERLVHENPTLANYRLELADSYQDLGLCLEIAGRTQGALWALDASIRTLRAPALPSNSGQDERLNDLYEHRIRMLSSDQSYH